MQAENAPFLHQVSAEIGVPEANLVAVLEIERKFHVQIFTATDPAVRRRLYADVYARVHPLLEADTPTDSRYTNLVRLFRRELQGKSIMDVGCGRGELLLAVHAAIPHGELCGLDTSSTHQPNGTATVVFLQRDIVDFRVEQSFDVVFSNQVLEHIAPADLPAHLQSIRRALKPGGNLHLLPAQQVVGAVRCHSDRRLSLPGIDGAARYTSERERLFRVGAHVASAWL